MSALECRLLYASTSPHLQQLYTGFLMLHRSGFLRLSQELRRTPVRYEDDAPHLRGAEHAHLDAVIGGRLRLHFDTHDAMEIAAPELDRCDLYFKRSYSPRLVESLTPERRERMRPLGLNYFVLPDLLDPYAIRRSVRVNGLSRRTLSQIKQALDCSNRLDFRPRLSQTEALPDPDTDPCVLFLVAAYDPHDDPSRTPAKVEERAHVNEMRARCLTALTRELGPRFRGGFTPGRFAREHYAGLLAPRHGTSQEAYLRTVRSFPICVATTGLHGSTGWKFAEYVAFSKAIVSEPLQYQVPGPFGPDRNFLKFTTADQCVSAAVRLIEDAGLRYTLMRNNAAYYRSHLRPDALVRNAIVTALEQDAPGVTRLADRHRRDSDQRAGERLHGLHGPRS